MVEFKLPQVYKNPDGWGPPCDGSLLDSFGEVFNCSFEHLEKYPVQRIGRICDFTASGQRFQEQRLAKGKGPKGKGKGPQPLAPGKDDQGFELVDSRPMPGKTFSRGRGFGLGRGKGRGKGLQGNYQEGILGQKQKPFYSTNQNQAKGKAKGGRGGGQQRRGLPSYKEWSVQTKTEWIVKREIQLAQLSKLQIDAREVKHDDLMWCGELHSYDKDFDRIQVRTKKPMRRFEDLNFFNVTTSDDPNLTDMLQTTPDATVIATDHVLACLIAAGRSIYSWDIVITKISNKLIFDKRDGSQVDFLSVNETATDPPNNDDKDSMNSPVKLSQEASCINQNFSQMVLDYKVEAEKMDNENPFEEEGDAHVASGAYRYRKITLPGNSKDESEFNQKPVSIIVRTEINCKMPGTDSFVSVKALNEFDPKLNNSWEKHLETQKGAVLANELKNNAFKLGRWTAQAILAGCDIMKIGYASRVRPTDPWSHNILGVQTHYTSAFAEQIGMTRNNIFGILRTIIDMVMAWDDGKYLLIKDPVKSVMRMFEVPWETFGEDDGDEEDEEEEDEEEEDLEEVEPPFPSEDCDLEKQRDRIHRICSLTHNALNRSLVRIFLVTILENTFQANLQVSVLGLFLCITKNSAEISAGDESDLTTMKIQTCLSIALSVLQAVIRCGEVIRVSCFGIWTIRKLWDSRELDPDDEAKDATDAVVRQISHNALPLSRNSSITLILAKVALILFFGVTVIGLTGYAAVKLYFTLFHCENHLWNVTGCVALPKFYKDL